MKPKIMIVDDEESIRNVLKSRLEREGHDLYICQNADVAQSEFEKGREVGVMITDIKMPGRDGFELMQWAKENHPNLKVIVITGHGEKTMAVKALREGASDYLEKPFDLDEMSHTVRRCLHEHTLESENAELVGRLEARLERVEKKPVASGWYESKSKSMEKPNEWLKVLRRESMRGEAEEPTVLIQGASGTGKEGFAQQVHQTSRRAKGPCIAVNCANFSEQLLESELFGHEKGSFTGATAMKRGLFELAKGGTLFLDEMGEMDVKLQAKLLRVLQEKVFRRVGGTADLDSDVRVVAATNRDLNERVQSGSFREDLYHRLAKVIIEVPALKERNADLVSMAVHFAKIAFDNRSKTFGGFTPDGEEGIRNYDWPGNVRELMNVVERVALIWQGGGPVSFKDLGLPATVSPGADGRPNLQPVANPFQTPEANGVDGYMKLKKKWAESFEREFLVSMLQQNGGNVSAAARSAQLDRSNFLRLLRRHGLKATEYRHAA